MTVKTKKEVILPVILITVSLTVLSGCLATRESREVVKKDKTEKMISELLKEKYSRDFRIVSLNETSDGMPFSKLYYDGRALCETDGTVFEYRTVEKMDGLRDNYQGYLYEEFIRQDIRDKVFSRLPEPLNYDVDYGLSEESYRTPEEYIESGRPYIKAEIMITASDLKEAGEKAFNIVDLLQRSGYGFSIGLKWNDREAVLYHGKDDRFITIAELIKEFED